MKSIIESAPNWKEQKYYKQAINLIDKFGEYVDTINKEYLYWDKIKYKKTSPEIQAEILWSIIKLSRSFSKKIRFGNYDFHYNITDFIQEELHQFDLNLRQDLNSNYVVNEEDKKRYLVSSIMEEAITSSQIEGAITSREKAKEMLQKNKKPVNKSEQMIVNNYNTIKHIAEIKNEEITFERLMEIHQLITNKTLENNENEGKYRQNNNINVVNSINGEIVHIPPRKEEITELMNALMFFFNDKNQKIFIHPIIKACIIHFMIGFIHPFVDGNGRTARALFYWYLLKNGYWFSEYLSISSLIMKNKKGYAMAYIYNETDENDLTYFINYKIKILQSAYQELKKYIQKNIKEKKEIITYQKTEQINERQAFILKWLGENPNLILTVKEIQIRFNISNQTARTDLLQLAELNYITENKMNKKTKIYFKKN